MRTFAPGRIREAKAQRGLSDAELARRLNISGRYLHQILDGEVSVSPWVAVRLETVLGLNALALMGGQLREEIAEARQDYKPHQALQMEQYHECAQAETIQSEG